MDVDGWFGGQKLIFWADGISETILVVAPRAERLTEVCRRPTLWDMQLRCSSFWSIPSSMVDLQVCTRFGIRCLPC